MKTNNKLEIPCFEITLKVSAVALARLRGMAAILAGMPIAVSVEEIENRVRKLIIHTVEKEFRDILTQI